MPSVSHTLGSRREFFSLVASCKFTHRMLCWSPAVRSAHLQLEKPWVTVRLCTCAYTAISFGKFFEITSKKSYRLIRVLLPIAGRRCEDPSLPLIPSVELTSVVLVDRSLWAFRKFQNSRSNLFLNLHAIPCAIGDVPPLFPYGKMGTQFIFWMSFWSLRRHPAANGKFFYTFASFF